MTVKEAELIFNLIEGEAEEKFLEKAILEMKERRSKYQKGGRFNNRKRGHNDNGNTRSSKRSKVDGD